MIEQISLFDFEADPYELKQKVSVVIPEEKRNDPESFYYLQKFEGKDCKVIKIVEQPSLQYRVSCGEDIAFVYHDELVAL